MGLFGKKKEKSGACCDCNPDQIAEAESKKAQSGIKILGSGCAKCKALEEATREALEELGLSETIDHLTDFAQIASYGVMTTPALVVDGKVVSFGKVLNKEEIIQILQKLRSQS